MSNVTIQQATLEGELDITDLTTSKLDGTGVFDKLLETARVHLDNQFKQGYIRGPEYATVYLGMFQAVLSEATQFLLSKERQALELKGLELQNELAQAQIDQIHDQMQKTPLEIEQLKAGTANTLAQTEGVVKETEMKQYQLDNLYPAQLAQAKAQTDNVIKDTDLKQYQIDFLYPAQLENANKQNDLLAAQILNQTKQLDLLSEQVNQAKAQTQYYAQKVVTEKAQTDATVIGNGSVVGVQVDLMNAQKDGYKRNAEQQFAQIMSNSWNVRRQTDEDTSANSTNLLDDATVGKAIQTMASGVGIILTPT